MSGEQSEREMSTKDRETVRQIAVDAASAEINSEVAKKLTEKAKEDRDNRIKHYEVLRDYVKHEDDLVNNRVTWILAIHGFMYATYGFTIQKKVEITQKTDYASLLTLADLLNQKNSIAHALWALEAFLMIIAVVGMMISYLGWRSIAAAKASVINVVGIFQDTYGIEPLKKGAQTGRGETTNFGEFPVPNIGGGGTGFAQNPGGSASVRIPWILLGSWFIALSIQVYFLLLHGNAWKTHFGLLE